MSELASLILDFGAGADNSAFSGLLLEVPTQTVHAGEELELRLWGPRELLDGWVLYAGVQSLGQGRLEATHYIVEDPQHTAPEYGGERVTQYLSFAGETEKELDFPVYSILSVTAATELVYIGEDNGLPLLHTPRGDVKTGEEARLYNVISSLRTLRRVDGIPIYGTLKVEYERIRWRLIWFFPLPQDQEGDHWFFLYAPGRPWPYRRFAIKLPDLATLSPVPRNITLRVIDDVTETHISGATIWLDGLEVGKSGEDGMLHLENVMSGEHALRATASGYLDTDKDELNNETLLVSGDPPQTAGL